MLAGPLLYIALLMTASTASARTTQPLLIASIDHAAQVGAHQAISARPETLPVGVALNNISLLYDGDHDRDDRDWDHDHDRDHHRHDKDGDPSPAPTPEPTTAVLAGVALLIGGGLLRHRRTVKQAS
jgi:hypothetical protein